MKKCEQLQTFHFHSDTGSSKNQDTMAAQNVHRKSQKSIYTCTTPAKSNLDSGEPGTSILEGRYACVLRIIGFTHYICYPLIVRNYSQRFILILLVPRKHCFTVSVVEIREWLSWLVLAQGFLWGIAIKISI